jgi:hypothetical protein
MMVVAPGESSAGHRDEQDGRERTCNAQYA